MSYLDTLDLMKKRRDNPFNGIPTNLGYLSKEILPSWDHRTTVILSATTGAGKTNWAWKHAVIDSIDFIKNSKDVDGHIYYFSLELSKHEMISKLFANLLFQRFGKQYSRNILMSVGKERLTDEEVAFIEIECKPYLEFVDSKLTILDGSWTPDKMLSFMAQTLKNTSSLTFTNIVIVDTTNAISADSGQTKIEALKKWNQEYCLQVLRNEKNTANLLLQQQDKASSTRQFTNRGESILDKYKPTLEGLGGDKESANSASLVISIYNPLTFGEGELDGYFPSNFDGGFRMLYVNKNNFGDVNLTFPFYFNGKTGIWTPIDEGPEEFRKQKSLYQKYIS